MNIVKLSTAAALVVLLGGAASAQTGDVPTTQASCTDMQKKVAAALSVDSESAQAAEARSLAKSGREYCGKGLYAMGIGFYSKALDLLK